MEMRIAKPCVKTSEGKARMSAAVTYGEKRWDIFYELDAAFEGAFAAARADGFLVNVLPLAMMAAREDKELSIVCEAAVSKRLYHQLVSYYIPLLCKNISYYEPVKICCEVEETPVKSMGAVGTGISGGVDSSYTIAKYMSPEAGVYRLTHGVFFNVGIYDGYDSPSEKMLEEKAQRVAEDTGISYLCVKSNACKDLYGKAHAPIVPFVFLGAVLALQGLFSVYYYSSGYSANEFGFSDAKGADHDGLTVQCFSTESVQIYSSGIESTRLEKVRYIIDHPFTYDNLAVCLKEDQAEGNCSRCAKCTRTMAELDCAGALERYKNVFDIEDYYRDVAYHWGYILLKEWGGDEYCREIRMAYKASGRKLPLRAYWGALQKWAKRGFTTVNRQREKVENRK
ncbi:MAG: hypothetical protein E7442_00255 [Ruminococcaceae bacterium]|nr:hypothetical protein [Oscillospiraceae bacterium]